MDIQKIPFSDVPQLSSRDIAYATAHPKLRPFYKYEVTLEAFAKVIADKQKDTSNRVVLTEVLQGQYADFSESEAVQANIEALKSGSTFTVTTAHQPSLFTGPLYFMYKIISVINLAQQLREQYDDYQFVPIFITGGEDHDFEEINHLHLFGNRIDWENDESGAVGAMKTESLGATFEALKDILGDSDRAEELYQLVIDCYQKHDTYGKATRAFVHQWFKDDGLVIIDMNDAKLKQLFIPYAKEELLEQASNKFVEATIAQLDKAGFSAQATPRAINLFYLRDQIRERIVQEDGVYKVLNTDYQFSKEEIVAELEQHPERFSPNVVMRPIYQEVVLPNLAYVGGGGELAYWLERKSQFEHFKINFPMLIRRNSVLWVDKGNAKRMGKVELTVSEVFKDVELLVKEYVKENTENEISLKDEKAQVQKIYDAVVEKAKEIDQTMVKPTLAEQQKVLNSLDTLEGKLLRAEKNRHDIAINQIRSLKDRLFPEQGLQERYENFMGFYLRYGQAFFEVLQANLDPLDKRFVVVVDG
jgi:bacillithiol synthase